MSSFTSNSTSDCVGHGNLSIFYCGNPECRRPTCYTLDGSGQNQLSCTGRSQLVRHVSFVDCSGHDVLMNTTLNGAGVINAVLLFIASDETFPQQQLSQHLTAIDILKPNNIIIVQSKIDLVNDSQVNEQREQIVRLVQGTAAEGAPIVPISTLFNNNINVLCKYIAEIPIPPEDCTAPPRMIVASSFYENSIGSYVGGFISQGVLRVDQEIEIRPGLVSKNDDNELIAQPILSRIVSLHSGQNDLQLANPGGLIGVRITIEPTLCDANRLVGQMLGAVGTLPKMFVKVDVQYYLQSRLLGVRNADSTVGKLIPNERLLVVFGSFNTFGKVVTIKGDSVIIDLTTPVCAELGEEIRLSRRVEGRWRSIGTGTIRGGTTEGTTEGQTTP